jgi:saccharopine dehydrogenase-like NADP-dependent oxidoreductase
MEIIVLGGSGIMGSEIVTQLIRISDVDITIAGIDSKALKIFAEKLGERVSTQIVDANNKDDLIKSIKDKDVIINAIGPFYEYGTKILSASIQAGIDYIDINDDYDATQEALNLHFEAEDAGITGIIGLGASPGFTNILAKYGADKLDEVNDIKVFWAESSIDPTGSAAIEHWLHIITGDVPMYKNGEWIDVKGLSEPEKVEFASPIGELDCYYTGHPEPVTLPRYIKDVKNVIIKGALFPPRVMKIWNAFTTVGLGSEKEFFIDDFKIPLRKLTVRLFRAMPYFAPKYFEDLTRDAMKKYKGCAGALKIEVSGIKEGRESKYNYDTIAGSVKFSTALPAALGATMILKNEINKNGVFAPEGVVDTEKFLSKIKTDLKIFENGIRL